jgi:hypothetical protein
MNLKQIREEAWDIAREIGTVDSDRLWTTTEMNRYINRVYRQIARETRCIRDATTLAICNITSAVIDYTTYTPGTQDYIWANDPTAWLYHKNVCPYIYTLDHRIIDVVECKWTSRQWRLNKVSVAKWQTNPWWEQVVGLPTEFCTDYSNNTLVLNFRSETEDTLRLVVKRMPITDLVADTDTPEIRTHYQDFMINGILAQMYSKQDADTIDIKKADNYQGMFLRDLDEVKQSESLLDTMLRPNFSTTAFR